MRCSDRKEKFMKSKTLIIDEEVQGEKIVDLNTEQLIKLAVKNIDDDVISKVTPLKLQVVNKKLATTNCIVPCC